jgi:hypothetical protein
MTDQPERPSYMKYAFANAYNLSLLGGAAVASAATSDWAIALIAGGLEALWLFIGADTAPFRRWVDRQHRARLLEATRARRRQRILALPDQRDRERAIDLIAAHREMGAELERNTNWSGELVRGEYDRLESLLDAWVDLAEAADRFEGYIRELDLNRLQREQQVQQKLAEQSGQDPESRGLAAKNADLLGKRLRTLQDMGTLVQRTRGQMGVIENTFRLLRDQIASLKVPQDIHGQIDEIVTNVDAVRSVLAEGDQNLREVAEAPATVAYDEPAHGPRTRVR